VVAGLAVRHHRRSVDPEALYAAEARKVALQRPRSCSGCGDAIREMHGTWGVLQALLCGSVVGCPPLTD